MGQSQGAFITQAAHVHLITFDTGGTLSGAATGVASHRAPITSPLGFVSPIELSTGWCTGAGSIFEDLRSTGLAVSVQSSLASLTVTVAFKATDGSVKEVTIDTGGTGLKGESGT